MAEVKLLISANADKADSTLRKMGSTAETVTTAIEREFRQLGIRSDTTFDQMRLAAQGAYDRIKTSGWATQQELMRAETALAAKMEAINTQQFGKRQTAIEELEAAYQTLGVKTSASFDKQREAATAAYAKIKASGTATAEDLVRAEKARASKIVAIDEEQFGKRTSMLQKFKASWIGVTATITASYLAVTRAWSLAEEAAQSRQGGQAFANLAASHGASADRIIADLKRISANTVSTQMLIEQAGTSMLLGIEANTLPKLMEIARASSRITGDSITKSFADISLAVGRQSRMILDNLGIIVQVEKANAEYAATVGKTASQLTDAERKQAFMNATLAAGEEIVLRVGAGIKTEAEKFAEFTADVENAKKSLGSLLSGPMAGISSSLSNSAQWLAAFQNGQVGLLEYLSTSAAYAAATGRIAEVQTTNLDALVSEEGKALAAKKAAAAQAEEAAKAAEEAAKLQEEAVKAVTTSISRYSRSIGDLGREQKRSAESGFSKDLERQEEFLKKTGTAASNLLSPMRSYIAVLDKVAEAQRTKYEEISEVLEGIGAADSARLQAQIDLQESVEKPLLESKRKAWESLSSKIEGYFSAALEDMKKKEEELLQSRIATQALLQSLSAVSDPEPEKDDFTRRLEERDRLFELERKALSVSNPAEQARQLEEVQKKWAAIGTEVRVGGDVLIDAGTAARDSADEVKRLGEVIEGLREKEVASAAENTQNLLMAKAEAEEAARALSGRIADLDTQIAEMTKQVTLTADDKITAKVPDILRELDKIKDREITITANYVSNIPGSAAASRATGPSGGGSVSPGSSNIQFVTASGKPIPQYAAGTPYVPRTGLALIHQGERIIPAEQNRKGDFGGTTVQIGDLNINMPNVTNQTSARQLARDLYPELQQLAARRRS